MNIINDIKKIYPILQAVFRIIPDVTFVKNKEFVYIAVSESFVKIVGKNNASEIIGKTDFEIFGEDLAKKHRMEDRWILSSGQNLENIVELFWEEGGTVRYDSISKYFLSDDHGNAIGIYGVQHDVTQDVLAQQQYDNEIQYLFELNENVYSIHLIDVDEWRIIHEKKRFQEATGVRIGEGIEKFSKDTLESVYNIESEAYTFYNNFRTENVKAIYQSGMRDISLEYQRVFPNGKIRWVQEDIKFIKNPKTGHLQLAFVIQDIEERKRKEQDLLRRAERDGLTGLYNRSAFQKKVGRMLVNEQPGVMHALFLLDVDNFKLLNDTQGHQSGDRFLIDLADIIKQCFRNTDIVGRLGGDEFLVLMKSTPGSRVTAKNAGELLKRVKVLCDSYQVKELSASIGISIYPQDGENFDELYKQADLALYTAKRNGKNQFSFASEIL